jgi:hypothetical protein
LQDNASIRDIQTDETMPPQGELSEQESIGADSASLWGPAAEDVSCSFLLLNHCLELKLCFVARVKCKNGFCRVKCDF